MRRYRTVTLLAALATMGTWAAWGASGLSPAPARASLLGSMRDAAARVRDALPVRIRLGPAAELTTAQRDSVRRARLARLAGLSGERPAAWTEDCVILSRGFQLTFGIADTVARDVAVHRRDAHGEWPVVGRVRADKKGRGTWRDTTSRAGRCVELALGLRTAHGTRFVPMPPVRLPGGELSMSASLAPDGS